MTNKSKNRWLITGLLVGLIVMLVSKRELSDADTKTSNNERASSTCVSHMIVTVGSQWIIQTTSAILKPNQ